MGRKLLKSCVFLASFLVLAAVPASATGDLICSIDNSNLGFALFAATNREHGTIVNVAEGSLRLKSKTLLKVAPGFAGELKVDRENIIQQWFLEGELRLAVNIDNEHGELLLAIVGQLNRKLERYAGRYVLKVSSAGDTRTVKGQIRSCSGE